MTDSMSLEDHSSPLKYLTLKKPTKNTLKKKKPTSVEPWWPEDKNQQKKLKVNQLCSKYDK